MWLIGIALGGILTINPYLRSIASHARWVDVLSLIGVPLVLLFRFNPRKIHILLGLGTVFLLLIPSLAADLSQESGEFGLTLPVHWLELSFFGAALLMLNGEGRGREGFAIGIILGAVGNCVCLELQALGYVQQLIRVGLSYPGAAFMSAGSTARYYGLHGHPNGAAAVISLCVPAAVALTTEFRRSWLFVLSSVVICISGAVLTSSRSAFLVAGVVLLAWLLQFRSKYKYFIVAGFFVVSSALIYLLAVSSLNERWSASADSQGNEENASVRWETTKESAVDTLRFPLGLGSKFHELLDPPLFATHNAFTQITLCAGLPLGLLVIASILNCARKLLAGGSLAGWLALHLCGLFFFEEHLNNPTFISLTLWIVLINLDYCWQALARARSQYVVVHSVAET